MKDLAVFPRRKCALLAGVGLSCLFSQSALAADDQAGVGITDIIVTARKSAENVQKIPLAVSVQTAEVLQEHQVTDAYALQSLTPSLGTQSGANEAGAPSFAIRGIGTAVIGPQVESSVGLVVDDVPIGRIQLANIEFFDLERVEVLRGPQGMLFGKNAAAGLINIVTVDPKIGVSEMIGNVQYGNMNSASDGNVVKLNVAANVPLSSNAALRLTGYVNHMDGLIENVYQSQNLGQTKVGGRAKLLFEASDSVKFLISGDYGHTSGLGEAVYALRFINPGSPLIAINAAQGITASPGNLKMASGAPNEVNMEVYGGSLKSEFELGDAFTLTNVVGYRAKDGFQTTDADSVPVNYTDKLGIDQSHNQFTEELRIASHFPGPFSFQAGAFYMRLKARQISSYEGNAGRPVVPPGQIAYVLFSQAFKSVTKSYAGFFEGQFKFSDQLRLTGGVRYTHDVLDYSLRRVNGPGNVLTLLPDVSVDSAIKKNNVSGRGSLDFQVTRDTMLYASYSVGYKGPTFDLLSGAPVGAEIPHDAEIGIKSTLFDRRLRLNVTGFYQTFKGFQTQVLDGLAIKTVNAGKLKAKGVEAEFTLVPVDGLTISGGVTYNDTKYVGLDGIPCYPGAPAGTGANECRPNTQNPPPFNGLTYFPFGLSSASGNPLAQAPKWTETVTVRYEHPVADNWTGFIQGDGYFRSSFNYFQVQDPRTAIGATGIFGVNLGAKQDDGRLGITFFVRNLFDKRVPVYINQATTASYTGDVGTPTAQGTYYQQFSADSFRTIGATLNFKI